MINSIYYRDLLKKGVGVYEYCPSILHAKIMIIDNWMMIGSSNLNSRTQKHDWEIDILLSKEKTKEELISRFEKDLSHSRLLKYSEVLNKFKNQQIPMSLLKSIKYFL